MRAPSYKGLSFAAVCCFWLAASTGFAFLSLFDAVREPLGDSVGQSQSVLTEVTKAAVSDDVSLASFKELTRVPTHVGLAGEGPVIADAVVDLGSSHPVLSIRLATAEYFDTLGVPLLLGTGLRQNADVPGLVLSYSTWRILGSNPDVVGSLAHVNRQPARIVGVAANGFSGTHAGHADEAWLPLEAASSIGGLDPSLLQLDNFRWIRCLFATTNANEARRVAEQLSNDNHRYLLLPIQKAAFPATSRPTVERLETLLLWLIVLGTGAIAINSVAIGFGLAAVQRRGIAIRQLLGASQLQALAGVAIIVLRAGTIGSLVGIATGYALVHALARLELPGSIAVAGLPLGLRSSAAIVCALGVLGTGTLILAAAWFRARASCASDLTDVNDRMSQLPRGRWLLCAEVAVAVIASAAAVALATSVYHTLRADLGFGRSGLAFFSVIDSDVPKAGAQRVALATKLEAEFNRNPEIIAVGIGRTPFGPDVGMTAWSARFDGRLTKLAAPYLVRYCDEGYLEALGVRLVAGRHFARTDRYGTSLVVVVTKGFAAAVSSDMNIIGHTTTLDGQTAEIVGIVDDAVRDGLASPAKAAVFALFEQRPEALATLDFAIHSRTRRPSDLVGSLRTAALQVSPTAELSRFRTPEDVIGREMAVPRLGALLSIIFGVSITMLAVCGCYGFVATAVAERRREAAIRLSLGESYASLVARFSAFGLGPVALGAVVGLGVWLAVGPHLQPLLFRTEARGASTLVIALVAALSGPLWTSLLAAYGLRDLHPSQILRA